MNTPRTPSSKDREQTRSHVPASSSSSVGTASLVNNGPSGAALPTLASLLTIHASSPNPMQAAAEAALADRNVLDTQNKQLWKLIEKQRLAYNQMSKDLDRIRAERDALKAKLANGTTPGEKSVRPSASSSAIQQVSRTSTDEGVPQRPRTLRHQSDGNDMPSSSRQPPPTPSRRTSNGQVPTPARGESLPSLTSSPNPNIHVPSTTAEVPVGTQTRQNTVPGANGTSKMEPAHSSSSSSSRQPITIPVPPPSAPAQLLPTVSEDSNSRASRESRISLPDEAKMYLMNGSPLPSPNPANVTNPNGLSPGQSTTNSARSSHDPGPSSSSLLNGVSPISPRPRSALPNTTSTSKSAATVSKHTKSASDVVREMTTPKNFVDSPSLYDTFSQRTDASNTLVDTESEVLDITDERDDGRSWNKAEDREVTNARTPAPPQQSRQTIRDVESSESMHTPLQSRSKYPQREDRDDEDSSHSSMLHSLQPRLRIGTDALEQTKQKMSPFGDPISSTTTSSPSFRALPLLSTDLPHTKVSVPSSSVRFNDRGKEVLSFLVEIDPGKGKERWQVEKLYSDVLGLDQRMRNMVGRSLGKKMGVLPEGKLWRHDAPAKIDQRKAALETYLQSLINLPVKNKDEVIAFFTSDIVRDTKKPVMQAGYKEGYLTKRGQKLGGWKTRYFVVHGPVLDYYENRGGAHLGSINITGAQIGRQTKTDEEENDYRHAFLIMEPKRGGSPTRHVLCAESDPERDAWIDVLLKYVRGTFIDEPASAVSMLDPGIPRTSISSVSTTSLALDNVNTPPSGRAGRSGEFDTPGQIRRGVSPGKQDSGYSIQSSSNTAYSDADTARRLMDRNQIQNDALLSSSLPTSSPLDGGLVVTRSSSEQGHYLDPSATQTPTRANHISPERERHWFRDRKTGTPSSLNVASHNTQGSTDAGHNTTELSLQTPRAKISAPMGGAVLPSGYKFGASASPADQAIPSSSDKRDKAKTRNFWAFGKNNGDKAAITYTNRDVFGVTIEESLEVASIANLPAVVFRCIQFLEAKKADQEEGIYRLSGSSAVIKGLKDRFNTESDINLLESEEYWDPHAIAGLLKTFLRDLPTSILTRELHLRFLSVIDFVDAQERVQELANLISALPLPNYSLLRALTAHLILIVQNANVNKMTMRNVGIVFSPTLGIPAGVFSLMLGEFNRVFNVDEGEEPWDGKVVGPGEPVPLDVAGLAWRNSRQYSDAAADHLLGIAGRTLSIPESDGETASSEYESEAESVNTVESDEPAIVHPPTPKSKASHHVAASRGLNIEVSQSSRGNRHSRILGGVEGLPPSPRPLASPSQPNHVSTR